MIEPILSFIRKIHEWPLTRNQKQKQSKGVSVPNFRFLLTCTQNILPIPFILSENVRYFKPRRKNNIFIILLNKK